MKKIYLLSLGLFLFFHSFSQSSFNISPDAASVCPSDTGWIYQDPALPNSVYTFHWQILVESEWEDLVENQNYFGVNDTILGINDIAHDSTYYYRCLAIDTTNNNDSIYSDTSALYIIKEDFAEIEYPVDIICQNFEDQVPNIDGDTGFFSYEPDSLFLAIDTQSGVISPGESEIGLYTVYYTTFGECPILESNSIGIYKPDTADVEYEFDKFCQNSIEQSPISIAGDTGTFSYQPSNLHMEIDPATGTITPSESEVGEYIVSYTTFGECPFVVNIAIEIRLPINAAFSYDNSIYCKTSLDNPIIEFEEEGWWQNHFSATPDGLNISVANGEIDLAVAFPNEYVITNLVEETNGCPADTYDYQLIVAKEIDEIPDVSITMFGDTTINELPSYCRNDKPETISLTTFGEPNPLFFTNEIVWYKDEIGSTPVSTGSELILSMGDIPDENTTYYVGWENICEASMYRAIEIVVLEEPNNISKISILQDLIENNIICTSNMPSSIKLEADGGDYESALIWSILDTAGNLIEIGQGNPFYLGEGLDYPMPDSDISFYARWENKCGESNLKSADIYFVNLEVIEQPEDLSICRYNQALFEVVVNLEASIPSEISYQWYKVGDTIALSDSSRLIIDTADLADNGSYFCKVGTDHCQELASDFANLTVYELPQAVIHKKGEILLNGDTVPVILFCENPGQNYQWFGPSVPDGETDTIHGATEQYFYPEKYGLQIFDGSYYVVVEDPVTECHTTSNEIDITLSNTTKDIYLYPNPAHNQVTLKLPRSTINSTQQYGTVYIWNSMGVLVFEEILPLNTNESLHSINISNYKHGVYYLEMRVENRKILSDKLLIY